MKLLTIIDCYIHNEESKNKLKQILQSLSSRDILLISNTPIPTDIQKQVKFSFYDSNNKLFNDDFNYVNDCWSNHWLDLFTIHEHFYSKQYHGLSVLYNLTNSITIAKSLGYTHFEKFEWDFKLGDLSIKNIDSLKRICLLNNKKSIFISNFNTDKPEFRFDYFMSEIDFFENHYTPIKCQTDYKEFLLKHYGNDNFINVEQFLFQTFNGQLDNLLLIDNDEIFTFFADSEINTKISLNYIPKYFNFCTTRLYKVNDGDSHIVLTYNYGNELHTRNITINFIDGSSEVITQTVNTQGSFNYYLFDKQILNIVVSENNVIIFEECVENVKSKIMFK
jgi:hypothetical protein